MHLLYRMIQICYVYPWWAIESLMMKEEEVWYSRTTKNQQNIQFNILHINIWKHAKDFFLKWNDVAKSHVCNIMHTYKFKVVSALNHHILNILGCFFNYMCQIHAYSRNNYDPRTDTILCSVCLINGSIYIHVSI